MKKRLILVDGQNRAHAAYHAYKKLSYQGRSVSMIYGFPSMMRAILGKERPDEMIICWDSEHSRKGRQAIFPGYKNRKDNPRLLDMSDFLRQLEVTKNMMYYLGVKQAFNTYIEADDMIYKLVKIGSKRYKKIVIYSGDKDFDQLINEKVSVYNEAKKITITHKNCHSIRGYRPDQCVDYLTLVGDTSDTIPGYPGIGVKKASELLERFGSLAKFIESSESFSIIDKELLLEIILRNHLLIDLKLFYQTKLKGKAKTIFYGHGKAEVNEQAFKHLCKEYNMNKLMGSTFIIPFKQLNHG